MKLGWMNPTVGYDVVLVEPKGETIRDSGEGYVVGQLGDRVLVWLPSVQAPAPYRREECRWTGRRAPVVHEPGADAASRFPWVRVGEPAPSLGLVDVYAFPMRDLATLLWSAPCAKALVVGCRLSDMVASEQEATVRRFSEGGWSMAVSSGEMVIFWICPENEAVVPFLMERAMASPRARNTLALVMPAGQPADLAAIAWQLCEGQFGGGQPYVLRQSCVDGLVEAGVGLLYIGTAHPYQDQVPILVMPAGA